jgi:nicotinamide-nucleotide amidase
LNDGTFKRLNAGLPASIFTPILQAVNFREGKMNNLTAMAENLGQLLKATKATVAVAESSSGGLVSAALLAIPGASSYFVGGGVIYTRDARRNLLGLPEEQVTMNASNEDYALITARAMQQKLGTTWGLSESGTAGPTGSRYGYDAGHVAVAVTGPVELSRTIETGSADREANMWVFAEAALNLLEHAVKEST